MDYPRRHICRDNGGNVSNDNNDDDDDGNNDHGKDKYDDKYDKENNDQVSNNDNDNNEQVPNDKFDQQQSDITNLNIITQKCRSRTTLQIKFDLGRSIIYSLKSIIACVTRNERIAIECQRKTYIHIIQHRT
jgi:hypothetical protein